MIMPELTEQASSEESLPETGMIGASDLFPVSSPAATIRSFLKMPISNCSTSSTSGI